MIRLRGWGITGGEESNARQCGDEHNLKSERGVRDYLKRLYDGGKGNGREEGRIWAE